ncbi:MAG: TusE/DsrC/DsvC family sulfur relay protein [Thiotrichales bacterium]
MNSPAPSHSASSPARPSALDFDEKGFLRDPLSWNKHVARSIAKLDGIGFLGPDHWTVLFHIREHYLTYGSLPAFGRVCRVHHLGKDAVRQLFGGCRQAWRVAGLPDPGDEALTYMQ